MTITRRRAHSTWSAVVWALGAFALVIGTPARARAETGYDAWLRYAALPEAVRARYATLPRTVTVLGDSLVLRTARDEVVRGLSSLLASPVQASAALPRTPAILLGTLDRVRPVGTGRVDSHRARARRLLARHGDRVVAGH